MRRAAVSLALVVSLGSCSFATKHPAATTGIVGASMGFGTCFLAVEKLDTCGYVGGIAGGGLFLITFLATTFLVSNADDLPPENPGGMKRVRGTGEPEGPYLPPDPNPLPATAMDAGVPVVPVDALPVTPQATDAGVAGDAAL